MADTLTANLEEISENPDARAGTPFLWPLEAVGAALLVVIVALLLAGVVSRYAFSLPVVWIDEVASLCFLWLAMIGSVIAIDRNEHLRLTLFLKMMPERLQRFVGTFAPLVIAAFLVGLTYPAYEYAADERFITTAALNIPNSFRASALPFGMVAMLALVLFHVIRPTRLGASALPISILATVAVGGFAAARYHLFESLQLTVLAQWGFAAAAAACALAAIALYRSGRAADLGDIALSLALILAGVIALWLLSPMLVKLGVAKIVFFLVVLVALCLVMGTPIAFCFGVGTLAYLAFATTTPTSVVIGRMDEGMSAIILISVPIFVLLGCVLDATGMGKAIVDFLASLLGHVKAGMSYVLLGSLFIVSGISGSKVSDMATVAPALFPEMKRRGQKPREMIALLATGAAMADTVPPSIVLIVLGSVASVSIAGLFTSGFTVAMVLLAMLAILARWKARNEGMQGVARPTLSLIGRTAIVATPALILPFIIRYTVAEGVATATEVSTIAVLYAMVIGIVLYGGISLRRIYGMLVETAAMTGSILLILGTASAMAWAITGAGVAQALANLMIGMPGGWLAFLAITIVVFLILGCVLEGLPAIVLMAPLMFPIAKQLGINDIHYSMVVVCAMNIGLMTPPIGIGFYLACKIGGVSPDDAIGAIWPYLIALMVGLVIIALVPWVSLVFI